MSIASSARDLYLSALRSAYVKSGMWQPLVDWLLIRDYVESGKFTNTGAGLMNPGNIMYSPGDKWGKKGPRNAINNTYYMAYPTLQAYANRAVEVLKQSPGKPIEAATFVDFVNRLKTNNYFGTNVSAAAYEAALRGAASSLGLTASLGQVVGPATLPSYNWDNKEITKSTIPAPWNINEYNAFNNIKEAPPADRAPPDWKPWALGAVALLLLSKLLR